MGTQERFYIAHNTLINVAVDGCEHLAAWCFDAPDSKPGTRAAQVRDCLNALRGLDVAKVEALLDAVRAESESKYDDKISVAEHTRRQHVRMNACDELRDSIRAGGGQ